MDRKKAPHKLQVEDSKQDDNSIVEMTQAKMDELKIFRGDAVILKGMSQKILNFFKPLWLAHVHQYFTNSNYCDEIFRLMS